MDPKYDPTDLALEDYIYDEWITKESDYSTVKGEEEELDDLPSLEGNEGVKERKGLKILTPNKILTRLSVLLAQIKAEYNSYKLKKTMLYFFVSAE